MTKDKNTVKPVKTCRSGRIFASIFMNKVKTKEGIKDIPSISFHRRYKTKEGEWKSTSKLDSRDIDDSINVLTQVKDFLAKEK